ncbi:MAG: spore cortex biosynthesis protein YabQ [Clostridia bacterium]|nr:spore cortex biosynthesis protein YabQ [Clostridia bacterium]
MNDNLSEFPILLCCLWAGAVLGIVYDALRLLRISGKKLAVIAADILFGICFFALVSAVLLYADSGRVRIHYFIAVFLAMLVWINYPGRLVRTALSCIKRKLFKKARGE